MSRSAVRGASHASKRVTPTVRLFQLARWSDAGKADPPDLRGQRRPQGAARAHRDRRRRSRSTSPAPRRSSAGSIASPRTSSARTRTTGSRRTSSVRPQLLGRAARFLRFLSAQPRRGEDRCSSIGLLREKLWAYPASFVVFGAFIAYQLYRYSFTHEISLILLSIFDLFVIALAVHEYRLLAQTPSDPLSARRNAAAHPRRRQSPTASRGASSRSAISTDSISATRRWSAARSRARSTSGGR